jgi:glycosyltransferase involved in cell wall biosynthesis
VAERHLITSEYPPQPGGVSDYTRMVAEGLAAAGDEVHIWCPPAQNGTAGAGGVVVHRELGRFAFSDLRRAGRLLDQFKGPRRLLVQWVPHGYGYRAMNLPFCVWLWNRAYRHHDRIELMVHEPFLSFGAGSRRQNVVAVVHRLMTIILLSAASRVWMTIPAWEKRLRPYALGRQMKFTWLPVASNIPVIDDAASVDAIRSRCAGAKRSIVGHFGAYDRHVTDLLLSSVPPLLQNGNKSSMLLLGRGSELLREELIRRHPEIEDRLHATGELDAADLSIYVSACDVMLQPYIDGVSSRRTSVMVALAHGVPIVTTVGEFTESLWAESAAVSLAPAGDVTAFVNQTQALLTDETKRLRLSAAARTLYEERFDVKRIITTLREARA